VHQAPEPKTRAVVVNPTGVSSKHVKINPKQVKIPQAKKSEKEEKPSDLNHILAPATEE